MKDTLNTEIKYNTAKHCMQKTLFVVCKTENVTSSIVLILHFEKVGSQQKSDLSHLQDKQAIPLKTEKGVVQDHTTTKCKASSKQK